MQILKSLSQLESYLNSLDCKGMAMQGLRGPDAMILNFFSVSNIPLFVTSDSDFENSLPGSLEYSKTKAIYFLQMENLDAT